MDIAMPKEDNRRDRRDPGPVRHARTSTSTRCARASRAPPLRRGARARARARGPCSTATTSSRRSRLPCTRSSARSRSPATSSRPRTPGPTATTRPSSPCRRTRTSSPRTSDHGTTSEPDEPVMSPRTSCVPSPIGELTVVAEDGAITHLLMDAAKYRPADPDVFGEPATRRTEPFAAAAVQLARVLRRRTARVRPAARPARRRLPPAGLGAAARDPLRRDPQLRRPRPRARRPQPRPGRRHRQRPQPDRRRRAVPPRHRRRRLARGVCRGAGPQALPPRAGGALRRPRRPPLLTDPAEHESGTRAVHSIGFGGGLGDGSQLAWPEERFTGHEATVRAGRHRARAVVLRVCRACSARRRPTTRGRRPSSPPCAPGPTCPRTRTSGRGSSPSRTARPSTSPGPAPGVPCRSTRSPSRAARATDQPEEALPDGALWRRGRPPRKQRQCVAYHHVAGLPHAEVAAIVGGTQAAARRAAADGIAALRRTYLANEDVISHV